MNRTRFPILTMILLCAAPSAMAAPRATSAPSEVVVGEARAIEAAPSEAATAERPLYGPIRAEDPVVRERIRDLYVDRRAAEDEAMARLTELNERLAAASDVASRLEIRQEGLEIKRGLERTNLELGLEIARLNEDAVRVTDFERALYRLDHPEEFAPVVDPSILEQRLQEREVSR